MDLLTGAIFQMIRHSLRNSSGEAWWLNLLAGALLLIMKRGQAYKQQRRTFPA